MGELRISLLGPFEVTLDGEPVTRFGADTARALLAYLVLLMREDQDGERITNRTNPAWLPLEFCSGCCATLRGL